MPVEAEVFHRFVDEIPQRVTVWRVSPDSLRCEYANRAVSRQAALPEDSEAVRLAEVFPGRPSAASITRVEQVLRQVVAEQKPRSFQDFDFEETELQSHWYQVEVVPMGADRVALLDHGDADARQRVLAAIVDSSDDAIIGKTLGGIILSWNRAAERIYGYTAAEIVGKSILTIVPEEQKDEVAGFHERLQRGERIIRHETRRRKKDGSMLDVSLTLSPIRDADGTIHGASTIARDITQLKRLQATIRQQESLERLGTLASGIAHDFNNLLAGVLGSIDLARSELPAGSRTMRHLDRVTRLSLQASEMCEQILNFAGERLSPTEMVQLAEVSAEAATLFGEGLPANVRLEQQLAQDLEPVALNRVELKQLLRNLLQNSWEACPASGGTIRLEVGEVEAKVLEGQKLSLAPAAQAERLQFLRVTDTGTGVSEAVCDRMFDPYYTTKSSGHGIGLASVLGIARNHGGGIAVDSKEGVGTSITVYFPSSSLEPCDDSHIDWGGSSKVVLLVDDHEDIRQIGKEILEGAGFQVVLACDGLQALELFRRHSHEIAVVVLDWTMPGMGGEGTLRAMRQVHPKLPVLLSSGYEEESTLEKVTLSGVQGFLKKPYRASQLIFGVFQALAPQ